jgi:hypothetical protein
LLSCCLHLSAARSGRPISRHRGSCRRQKVVHCLWLEVQGRLVAAVHVEGHGGVLVDDPPGTTDAAQAHRRAGPDRDAFATGLGPADPDEAVAEAEVAAHGDAEIAQLEADRAVPGGEPGLQVRFAARLRTRGRQRRRDGRTSPGPARRAPGRRRRPWRGSPSPGPRAACGSEWRHRQPSSSSSSSCDPGICPEDE